MGVDLVEWLRAQLDEDERLARLVAEEDGSQWSAGDELLSGTVGSERATYVLCAPYNGELSWPMRQFLAGHDPARVLREVEAKRRIVNSFAAGMEDQPLARGTERYAIVRMVLRLLALPYSDRPGYREERRP